MNAEKIRQDFSRFQKRREIFWSPKINAAIQEQIQGYIKKYGTTIQPNAIIDYAPIHDVLKKLYIDAGINWGAKTSAYISADIKIKTKARMPIGLSEFLIQSILKYFEINLLNDVIDISETTRKDILKALTQATIDGLGYDDTIALITNKEVTKVRARLIARTETVTAANKGAALSASQSGVEMVKEWIAAQDNRTRYDHAEVNGITINEFDNFIVGGYPMQQPGDRGGQGNRTPAKEICNCRCAVGYSAKRDSNGRLIYKPNV